jgi:lipoyl(octanoyl) transferase
MIRPHLTPLPQGEEAGFAAGEGSSRIFAALNVFHDVDSRSAALNMAIDEALLETATAPTIRFYRWDHPALSFGYFGKFADVENEKRDLVRRWTGGGIVFHGDDLTYSIVIPASDPAFSDSTMSIYEKVHRAVCDALRENGKRAELIPGAAVSDRRLGSALRERRYSEQCFTKPVRADVLLNGQKIAGAAQRRTRRGLLQQGSIQNVDLALAFAKNVAAELSQNCVERAIDRQLIERAQQIAGEKYATPSWLRRR